MTYKITAFYRFSPIDESSLPRLKSELTSFALVHSIYGLILLGKEGINGTVAGPEHGIAALKKELRGIPGLSELEFKDSESATRPFRRFKVDIRPEIVTLKREVETPDHNDPSHVSPAEWERLLNSAEDYILIDVRNDYETAIGKFKGAVDPKLKKFSDFPAYVEESDIPKDKKVLMYCTGGIRCEKAYHEMKQRGFENVFQLEGGILKYLEQFPEQSFEGECFVFDHRVAVDQKLAPSQQYKLCPHCGNPGAEKINCANCCKEAVVCKSCLSEPSKETCSKNCAYHTRKKREGSRRAA